MESLKIQIGGDHYKHMAIQPTEYCQRNRLNFCESAVVKYVSRHASKGGRKDIEKAIHFLEMLLDIEYQQADPDLFADPPPIDNAPKCQACKELHYGVGIL
jgi:hypothetical protein